jgi:hypothetical protein
MRRVFKGAPGFKQWPDAVDGNWKIELLRYLGSVTGISTLVETGTCEGVTPWNLQNDFKEIYTVELHDGLYQESRKRLDGIPNVHLFHDSSPNFLKSILMKIPPSIALLFWLDAHSSGPHTADAGDVLPEEIKTITSICPDALIVVDDMMGLDQFTGQIGGIPEGWHAEYRTGEIIMHQIGRFRIPEFE